MRRRPVPWKQLVEPVDLVIMDAVKDVSQPGLRIETAHLGCLDERHRPGQRFATAVGASEEPVLPPDTNRAHGALGRFVVDADTAIIKEELEGRPAAETIAENLGGNAQQLDLGPYLKGFNHRACLRLTCNCSSTRTGREGAGDCGG